MKRLILSILTIMTISSMHATDKVLVAYFSATGTTKNVAEQIALATGGELLAIEPVQPYTSADLDWHDKQSRSSIEMREENARPAIKKTKENLDAYSVVYIGFPIWWYVAPRIINTFIETYDLTGKTIIPFATSGGSDIAGGVAALRKTYPNLHFEKGKLLNYPSYEEIEKWVKQ